MHRRWILIGVLAASFLSAFSRAAEPRPLALADQMSLRIPMEVAAGPSHGPIIFSARSSDLRADRFVSHLYLLESGGIGRQLTHSTEGESHPRLSPDGSWLAFLSTRPADGGEAGEAQIWILPTGGGEARPLTGHPSDVEDFAWCPDGSAIIFTAGQPSEEKSETAPRVFGAVDSDPPVEFWRVSVPAGAAERIVTGPAGVDGFDLSPDGRQLVFAANGTGKMNEDQQFNLYRIDLAKKELHPLTTLPGPETQPRWSPDGRWIAYISQTVPDIEFAETDVSLIPADGGAPRNLTAAWPRAVECFEWLNAGEILFLEADGLYTRPCRLSAATGAVTVLDPGPWNYTRICRGGPGETWLLRAGRSELPEVVSWDAASKFRLRSGFSGQLEGFRLSERRVVRWQGPGALPIEGLLALPPNFTPGIRVPLVVAVHGGPYDRFTDTLLQYEPWEDLTAKGYAVLGPNVRGSSGYDDAFGQANRNDLGGGDFGDLMAGVDSIIAQGIADPQRLGIVGGSFGGFMVNWVITHTPRFRAAVSMFGIWSLFTDFGNSEQPCWEKMFTGKYFWEPGGLAEWLARSPMTAAAAVQTPVLILHGDDDVLTDRANSHEMWQALRLMGKTVEYVRYPGESHGLSRRPGTRLDVCRRMLAWFDKYLAPVP
jgi:dipeptidyl aminopeptidase/acylaminoacyl peptidase